MLIAAKLTTKIVTLDFGVRMKLSVSCVVPAAALMVSCVAVAQTGNAIRVESATYGGNVDVQAVGGNATDSIARWCDGHSTCRYTVEAAVLGDPWPHQKKDFAVRFNCDGRNPRTVTVPAEADRHSVDLICP